ncbi:MAG: hypothetical protein E7E17_01120 [Veillonella sp.]|nr:hypothetical protein [Veillonella sp.]
MGVHHSTVARELNRIEGEYSAIKAQQLAISKSANKGRPLDLFIRPLYPKVLYL